MPPAPKLCAPCRAAGRQQAAHRIVDGVPKCRWCTHGLPHPAAAALEVAAASASRANAECGVGAGQKETEVEMPKARTETVAKKFQEGISAVAYIVRKKLEALGLDTRRHRRSAAVGAGLKPAPTSRPHCEDIAVRYRLVERTEKVTVGKAACQLAFEDGVAEGGVHRLVLSTVPAISRQFQLGEEYIFSWEPAAGGDAPNLRGRKGG